jgi:Zn-dependent peptidase ImmA (M78 family)
MSLVKEQIERIEALTRDLLVDAYGNISNIHLPINLDIILIRENLKLQFFDPQQNNDLNEVDGAYNKDKKTIFISSTTPYPRVAFTISHELGHYFLHQERTKDIFYRMESIQLEQQDRIDEQEANWFAASLLMPRELVEKYWSFRNDVDAIADKFYVSSSAAFWRLKNLELL